MASSFSDLKKNREKSLELLKSTLNPERPSYKDEEKDFWKPTKDKAGNAFAIIRFLPAPPNEDLPIVNYFQHEFKYEETGRVYIQRSLTSLGEGHKDPCAEWNSQLWKAGLQDQARKQKRKMKFVANIYVIQDKANPDAEGKVWKYRFGTSIKDMINIQAAPVYEGETPVDVFDLWEGANFKLKMRKKDGFDNYDLSSFDEPSKFMGGDEEAMEAIWRQCHSLQAEVATEKYKSYDVLLKILNKVRGIDEAGETKPAVEAPKTMKRQPAKPIAVVDEYEDDDTPPFDMAPEDDDEGLKFFNDLANRK